MSGNRVVTIGGGALLAGVGYYFYQAGGDPKVAQKKAEADAAKLSHEVRDHIPGAAKEAKKDAESAAAQAQSKFNQLGRDAKDEASKVDAKLQDYRAAAGKQLDAAGKEINKGINKFDNTVEAEASKAKSGLSGWFGGK